MTKDPDSEHVFVAISVAKVKPNFEHTEGKITCSDPQECILVGCVIVNIIMTTINLQQLPFTDAVHNEFYGTTK